MSAPSILDAFPTANDLLAAQPEELAGVLVEVLPHLMQQPGVQFTRIMEMFYPPSSHGPAASPSYAREKKDDVALAIAETLSWLQQQGLLVINPSQPQSSWYVLTRRGRAIKTRDQLATFARGRELPINLLQPDLADRVFGLYLRGDYDTAIFQAFKLVEITVREAAGCEPELPAQKVMRRAFHTENGPLTDRELPPSEQQAMQDLFAGAMGHAKNPQSHRDVKVQRVEAARLILFASYLLELAVERSLFS